MRRFPALVAIVLVAVCGPAFAEQNYPPPEFSMGYEFPEVFMPGPRAGWIEYVDVAVLALALALAAYLAHRRRSRSGMVLLTVFSLLYFGFYRKGCICAIGAIQNVALALADPTYALPVAAGAFFLLPLLAALFFGRVFCAGVCPLGAIQEIVLLHPVKVPKWLDGPLSVLPALYLGFAVLLAATGSAFIICEYDPFVLFFRLSGPLTMLIFGVVMLLIAVFVGRPYCRYLCPYGVLLGLVSPAARWKVSITGGDECIQCHLCADACPYGAIEPPVLPTPMADRKRGKRELTLLLVLLPAFLMLGAGLARLSSPVLARADSRVRLADRLWLEEAGHVEGQTEASEAFDIQGRPTIEAYAEAAAVRGAFDRGSWWLGIWIGLVFWVRMIGLSIRRHHDDYRINTRDCVACARCFRACPLEHTHNRNGELPSAGGPAEGTQ